MQHSPFSYRIALSCLYVKLKICLIDPVILAYSPANCSYMAIEMDVLKKKVGRSIFTLRKAARMTQSELAEAAGIGNEYISKIERGLGSPSLETLAKIAQALQVEMKVLFDFQIKPQVGVPKNRLLKLSSALRILPEKDVNLIRELAKRLGKRQHTQAHRRNPNN